MTSTEELLEQIRSGPSGPQIAAFFDFDGTLIDGYSAAALYEHGSATSRSASASWSARCAPRWARR